MLNRSSSTMMVLGYSLHSCGTLYSIMPGFKWRHLDRLGVPAARCTASCSIYVF